MTPEREADIREYDAAKQIFEQPIIAELLSELDSLRSRCDAAEQERSAALADAAALRDSYRRLCEALRLEGEHAESEEELEDAHTTVEMVLGDAEQMMQRVHPGHSYIPRSRLDGLVDEIKEYVETENLTCRYQDGGDHADRYVCELCGNSVPVKRVKDTPSARHSPFGYAYEPDGTIEHDPHCIISIISRELAARKERG